jgi:hypothetical protein
VLLSGVNAEDFLLRLLDEQATALPSNTVGMPRYRTHRKGWHTIQIRTGKADMLPFKVAANYQGTKSL